MRKWFGVLFLCAIIYLATTKFSLSNVLYVSSCHFAYQDDEYRISALILENDEQEIIKSNATSLGGAFTLLSQASSLLINFRHIESIVLDYSILNEKHIEAIRAYLLNNSAIDFNFYLFASEISADEIFSYENPKGISSYYSLLNVDYNDDSQFSYAKPCHLISFLKGWSDDILIKLPIIGLSEVFSNKNLTIKGVLCLNKKSYYSIMQNDWPFLFLFNDFKAGVINLSSFHAILNSNDVSFKYGDNLTIRIRIQYEGLLNLDNSNDLEAYLNEKVLKLINYFEKEQIDYFNIAQINELRSCQYSYDNITIDLKTQKK